MPTATSNSMDFEATKKYLANNFDKLFVKPLSNFIAVPSLTPLADPEFLTNGKIQKAAKVVDDYIKGLGIVGLTHKVYDKNGTVPPLNVYVVEPFMTSSKKNVMIYAHLDKQPHGPSWDTDPCDPVVKDNKLYGRGSVDDGYAPFASFLAVKNIQEQKKPHPRLVFTFESEEESGSLHLLDLLKEAKDDIQTPDVLLCLDGANHTYDRMWVCNSLRGSCNYEVTVKIADIGYHSGVVGGVVPDTGRIMRSIMDRIDDATTGKILASFMGSPVPADKKEEAKLCAELQEDHRKAFPIVPTAKYMGEPDIAAMYLASIWEPTVSLVGAAGLPSLPEAGNVIRPLTTYKFMSRLSPNVDAHSAVKELKELIEKDPPYGAEVTCKINYSGKGFYEGTLAEDVKGALDESTQFFGKKWAQYGIGGTIPFISELKGLFPKCTVLCMGAMHNDSGAHGPNEFLRLDYAEKLIGSWSHLISKLAQ